MRRACNDDTPVGRERLPHAWRTRRKFTQFLSQTRVGSGHATSRSDHLDSHARAAYAWHMPDSAARHVKLFTNGRNQAVRIPREFELPGEDAIMRKEGDRLIIEPVPPRSLLGLLATLAPIDEDFPAVLDLPVDDVDL